MRAPSCASHRISKLQGSLFVRLSTENEKSMALFLPGHATICHLLRDPALFLRASLPLGVKVSLPASKRAVTHQFGEINNPHTCTIMLGSIILNSLASGSMGGEEEMCVIARVLPCAQVCACVYKCVSVFTCVCACV